MLRRDDVTDDWNYPASRSLLRPTSNATDKSASRADAVSTESRAPSHSATLAVSSAPRLNLSMTVSWKAVA